MAPSLKAGLDKAIITFLSPLFYLILVFFTAIFLRLLYFTLRYWSRRHEYKHLPYLEGKLPMLMYNNLEYPGAALYKEKLLAASKAQNNAPILWLGSFLDGSNMVTIISPEVLREIYTDKANRFPKHRGAYYLPQFVLGKGLVTSEGELWQKQRKLITPLFHFARLKNSVLGMQIIASQLVQALVATSEDPVDPFPLFANFTLQTVIDLAFGKTVHHQELSGPFLRMLADFEMTCLGRHFFGPFWNYLIIFNPVRRMRKEIGIITRIVDKAIAKVRELDGIQDLDPKHSPGLLHLLVSEQLKGASHITNQLILDEAMTFLFAGFDTTANTLAWTMHKLGAYPDIQEKVYQEINSICGNAPVDAETLLKLEYTKAFVHETMRYEAIVAVINRETAEACTLGGFEIPKGTCLSLHVASTMMMDTEWGDPETFRPERFLRDEENEKKRHAFAFPAFSAGSRNCLGQAFAIQETLVALVAVVSAFRIELRIPEGKQVFGVIHGTNTPQNLQVSFVPRRK